MKYGNIVDMNLRKVTSAVAGATTSAVNAVGLGL